jgi:hypothetical protein
MQRFIYRPPIIYRSPSINSSPYIYTSRYINSSPNRSNNQGILKNTLIIDQDPTIKSVIIEVFYTILFSHHLPTLLKGGGLLGETNIISFDSVTDFFNSYIGKIVFYLLVFFILHFIILKHVKKIDLKKFL